ncbi:hypothetical protein GM415_01670 [Pseudodesulfovibrio cashew]|uniref:Uncharacterized protein n=1 Tax=Pseudodesulfovibrio cashew TaxID=2678688 RepID=A0A6I6JFU9_9BACT|nr:hypothetical protein [Pseudodesulfovibrio cashew]QGY38897.1 hypothetical protein GM415_01670 [Pseudodesulfovibrio cashew]
MAFPHRYRLPVLVAALLFCVLFAAPALASLPYYNRDLGYTIWLGDGWSVAENARLERFALVEDGLDALAAGWEAGYVLNGSDSVCLLVSKLSGRVVSRNAISEFNRHVVRQLQRDTGRSRGWRAESPVHLRRANYDSDKAVLRLEMDATGQNGRPVSAVVYIVYTRGGMLKFLGLTEKGDAAGLRAIDKAVSTLYLDQGLSQ